MENLIEGFEPVSLERWKQQIEKDLKGISFDQLAHTDDSGLTIFPFYNAENSAPVKGPLFTHTQWDMATMVQAADEKTANATALADLNNGADSLVFPVTAECNIAGLLKGVSIEHIRLAFVFPYGSGEFAGKLLAFCSENKIDAAKLSGALIADPVNAVVRGSQEDINAKWESWKKLAAHELVSRSGFTPFVTDAFPYHNAGATAVTELACTLAHLNEQLHFMQENKMQAGNKDFYITACASINFFESVAKLRALRSLAAFLLEQYGLKNRIFIHVSNTLINKTARDIHNNLIRSTIEGMSAVAGGADSVMLFPYDFVAGNSDRAARRFAVNQLMMFREEAFLSRVADMGAGSFFIEEYTRRLAGKAWDEFRAIEKQGGLIAFALSGALKKRIDGEAAQLGEELRSGKKILTGVNKFRNEKETPAARTFSPPQSGKGLSFFIAEEIIAHQLNGTTKEHA